MKNVKTTLESPSKEHVERMLKIAYYIDKNFLKPIDYVNFGINIYRLKEFGEVRLSKTEAKLRPHSVRLWERLSKPMRAMFLWSHFLEVSDELRDIHKELRQFGENTQNYQFDLDLLLARTATHLPKELKEKLEGFGKEWLR